METNKNGSLTGPTFLFKTGLSGGGLSLFNAIARKGLLSDLRVGDFDIPTFTGPPRKVAVLGAGVAGLATAYELLKQNSPGNIRYEVTVLEAMGRVGGRSLTVRPGDKFTEELGGNSYTQECKFFDEYGQPYPPYLNAGPGRIPSGHRNVLNLCQELGVQMQVYIMESRSNRVYSGPLPACKLPGTDGNGDPDPEFVSRLLLNRRVSNDTRGRIAAYMWTYVDRITDLNQEEKTEFRSLLRSFGMLQADGTYTGSTRSGYLVPPSVDGAGVHMPPMSFRELLSSAFWKLNFYQPEDYLWQPTSFQPVGGMDMIEKALEKAILDRGGKVLKDAPALRIRRNASGFSIQYAGQTVPLDTDICVSNIPIPLLEGKLDLSGFRVDFRRSMEAVFAAKDFLRPTTKVGWQAERRFWQNPSDPREVPIFGGISYTSDEMTQMWYPSDNFLGKYGVLTGAYNYEGCATRWGKLPPEQRLELARHQAAHLHGEEFARNLQNGLAIAWQNIPTQRGGWNDWAKLNTPADPNAGLRSYNILKNGDKGFYLCGDQISYLPGWKEGAVESALHVFGLVTQVRNYVPAMLEQVPDTVALTQGHYF